MAPGGRHGILSNAGSLRAVITLTLELVIAPILVGGSTLACRWWGARIGGLISAFPAVIGLVLLITAHERGALFTARAANGTLLGLVALSGFVLVYSRLRFAPAGK